MARRVETISRPDEKVDGGVLNIPAVSRKPAQMWKYSRALVGLAQGPPDFELLSLNLSPSTVLLTDRTSVDSLCYLVVVPTESAQ